MVFSVKENKNKIIAVMVLVGVIICSLVFLPKMLSAPEKQLGETSADRISFLESFGWKVSESDMNERTVTIPLEFSEVYNTYNVMQIAQGYDLKPFAGKICTQYIYRVENYPITGKDVNATLLVYEGEIIGGDISCSEVDGFMHGFAQDSEHFGKLNENYNGESSELEQTNTDVETSHRDK